MVDGVVDADATLRDWAVGDGCKGVAMSERVRVALPGITTLEKMVASGREAADRRLWTQLAAHDRKHGAGSG